MRQTTKQFLYYLLRTESRLVLWKYKPKIIAITGSVGKTSTKDAVYAAIAGGRYVRKSEKSYNSEIGLPLTILGLPNGWNNPVLWTKNILKGLWLFLWPHKYPEWLVLEAGVGKPGDMRKTAMWLQTDVVIVTAIGETPVHIEFFESRDHLIREKAGLIDTLKRDGLLLVNADDASVLEMKDRTRARALTFGFSPDADVRASNEHVAYTDDGKPTGFAFHINENGNSLPVEVDGVFGKNHMYAALAALAVASGLRMNVLEAINALRNYEVPPGRMHLIQGQNETMILDDTYNSSPAASELALKTLGEVKTKGRKIAVLGDMLELGRHTEEAHRKVGELAKQNADILFTVGLRAKEIKEGAKHAGMSDKNIFEFLTATDAAEKLRELIKTGDFILVKGSQGMRMERVVEAIMLERDKRRKLLVRQDPEWLAKK